MPYGLRFDREWMLVNQSTGMALSQKVYPRMALIHPVVDLVSRRLEIKLAGSDESVFHVSLDEDEQSQADDDDDDDDGYGGSTGRRVRPKRSARVCAESVEPLMYGSSHISSKILSDFLGVSCVLARLPSGASTRHAHHMAPTRGKENYNDLLRSVPTPILLSNESPFLLINGASVDAVRSWAKEAITANDDSDELRSTRKTATTTATTIMEDFRFDEANFRANLTVRPIGLQEHTSSSSSGVELKSRPFIEDTWDLIVSLLHFPLMTIFLLNFSLSARRDPGFPSPRALSSVSHDLYRPRDR
jgi:molybdenum cofactor sulfurtransferase